VKVHILKVDATTRLVEFDSSDFGSGTCTWSDWAELPDVGEVSSVELDMDDVVKVTEAAVQHPSVESSNQGSSIAGMLVHADDDNIWTVAIKNFQMLITVEESAPKMKEGQWIAAYSLLPIRFSPYSL
jgi:hypothetical protein